MGITCTIVVSTGWKNSIWIFAMFCRFPTVRVDGNIWHDQTQNQANGTDRNKILGTFSAFLVAFLKLAAGKWFWNTLCTLGCFWERSNCIRSSDVTSPKQFRYYYVNLSFSALSSSLNVTIKRSVIVTVIVAPRQWEIRNLFHSLNNFPSLEVYR